MRVTNNRPKMKFKIDQKPQSLRHTLSLFLGFKNNRDRYNRKPLYDQKRLLLEATSGGETEAIPLNLGALLKQYEITPKGVIYVGSLPDCDLMDYLNQGVSPILYIEPNPSRFAAIPDQTRNLSGMHTIHATITNYNGSIKESAIPSYSLSSKTASHDKKLKECEVPARTIDHILFELDLSQSGFNLLVLDIYKITLSALQGAAQTLQNIDAVISRTKSPDVNDPEADVLLLESHLGALGFNRAAVSAPSKGNFHETIYLKRPALTMTSLGNNGRFANQIFQYLYLKLVANTQGAIVQTPDWLGKDIYAFTDPEPIRPLPEVRESAQMGVPNTSALPDASALVSRKFQNFPDCDFWGYFQFHSSLYAPQITFIRTLLTPSAKIEGILKQSLHRLHASGKKIIALHLRRGDYGYDAFFRAPCIWYQDWLCNEGITSREFILYIASEDAKQYISRFSGFEVYTNETISEISGDLSWLIDFYILQHANILAISNSSFSFLASMLNTTAATFVRPCAQTRALITYDPLNAPVIFGASLSSKDHAELATLD